MIQKVKVGLIYGGESFEHEVSKMTAKSIEEHIDREKFEIKKIYIELDGTFDHSLLDDIDVAFLAVHGPNCEDGSLQKLLKKKKIRFTGSGILASQINMSKKKMHRAFKVAGLPIVAFFCVKKSDGTKKIHEKIVERFGYPCFVKPDNAGSSVGISTTENYEELKDSLKSAFQYDSDVVIEAAVKKPREIEIAILGNKKLFLSGPGEIMSDGEFYSYEKKYFDPFELEVVANNLSKTQVSQIKELAKKAYLSTNCKGYARADFFINENNEVYINELNTLPGFTATSMYPKMMEAAGISYKELITRIIELAFKK